MANMKQLTDSQQAWVTKAAAAAEVAREYAAWGEQHGRLHAAVVQALREAGVPRLFLPHALGGEQVDPVTCALVTETLAQGDASAAWFVMVYNAARIMAATWPAAMVETLWGDNPDTLVAASGHTPLRGRREGAGYVVSGTNSFVSGCHHADFIMAPMLVDDAAYVVVVPADACVIEDNWHTMGMRGTGSNDVTVPDVYVPGACAAQPGAQRNDHYQGTLYQCPSRVVFATYVPAALSLAQQALSELESLAAHKVPYATDRKLAHRALAQVHFGRGLAEYRAARAYFFDSLQQTWEDAAAGLAFDERYRADLYLAGTHAMQASSSVVRHVADAAGSSTFDKQCPLEKVVRDMETLRHHGFANESRYGSVAQVHWHVELDYPLLLR
jgi:alkylation response protein AidB-like acyl-CoA dehydrogenase